MDVFKLYSYLHRLKKLKRKGWTRYFDDVESVADHSFGVSFLVMVMADKLNLDTEKCLRMSLIHEIGESIIGDLTPEDEDYSNKAKLEQEAVDKIINDTGLDISELWNELLTKKTKESQLVHDMDKIEMALQALEYENFKVNLTEFFEFVEDKLILAESKDLFNEILKKRIK
jgi:putative hydrolase of HD superfamily